jgi:hypothetical protein
MSFSLSAQTVWNGPEITFTKENNADWTLEENQDRLTDNVWLTRQNNRGLFNIVVEASDADGDACAGPEPTDTEWAYGSTSDFSGLTFQPLGILIGCDFENLIDGENLVVHLISDDIYFDLTFTSWAMGGGGYGGGGGFAYTRTTDESLSIIDTEAEVTIDAFPNPATDFIQISGLTEVQTYRIYNLDGKEVTNGLMTDNDLIDIQSLARGMYFLQVDNASTLKFIKE